MTEQDLSIDRTNRAVCLISDGLDIRVISFALGRAYDAESFGIILGFLEDLQDAGFSINDPDK